MAHFQRSLNVWMTEEGQNGLRQGVSHNHREYAWDVKGEGRLVSAGLVVLFQLQPLSQGPSGGRAESFDGERPPPPHTQTHNSTAADLSTSGIEPSSYQDSTDCIVGVNGKFDWAVCSSFVDTNQSMHVRMFLVRLGVLVWGGAQMVFLPHMQQICVI